MYTQNSAATGAILASILGLVTPSYQQKIAPTTNFTAWELPTQFPEEQTANVSRYLEEARDLSTPNFRHIFQNRCITTPVYGYLSDGATEPGWVEPYPAFDGVYFVGSTWVSAWAIDTGDGLILIDALDNADEARELIIAGIQKFGFEGADIKAAIITHEHADHYGGARWLQETFDTPIYMSEVAWDGLATDPANPGGLIEPPVRNLTLEDGVGVTVGNVTVIPVATPGHTAGTVSLLFPVYENGVKHGTLTIYSSKSLVLLTQYLAVAALYGGNGVPANVTAKEQQIQSFDKFAQEAAKQGADVLVGNHANQDDAVSNLEILKKRPSATCGLTNPFIVSTKDYVRYLQMNSACVRVQAARVGQFLSI